MLAVSSFMTSRRKRLGSSYRCQNHLPWETRRSHSRPIAVTFSTPRSTKAGATSTYWSGKWAAYLSQFEVIAISAEQRKNSEGSADESPPSYPHVECTRLSTLLRTMVTHEMWERVQAILDGWHDNKHRKTRHEFANERVLGGKVADDEERGALSHS